MAGTPSLGDNLRGVLTHAERLARTEMELALVKGKEGVRGAVRNVALLSVAGLFVLGGVSFLLHAVYTALSLRMDPWLAALSTAVTSFVFAFLAFRMGVSEESSGEKVKEFTHELSDDRAERDLAGVLR